MIGKIKNALLISGKVLTQYYYINKLLLIYFNILQKYITRTIFDLVCVISNKFCNKLCLKFNLKKKWFFEILLKIINFLEKNVNI